MMGYGWGMGVGGWIAMSVFWIALLVLIVWAVARAFPAGGAGGRRGGRGGGGEARIQETPEEILDRRYAAGELDTESYQSMRATLASARPLRK